MISNQSQNNMYILQPKDQMFLKYQVIEITWS